MEKINGKIFDRSHEADLDITNHSDAVYHLYARKQDSYYVKTRIPLTDVSIGKVGPYQVNLVSDQVSDQVSTKNDIITKEADDFECILIFCREEKSKKEICEFMGYHNRTFFTRKYLAPLIQRGELKMTQPDKPNSRNQKYFTVKFHEK